MNAECTICTEWIWTIPATEQIYVTRCGHIFHHTCLTRWMGQSQTCPQCRNSLPSNGMFRLYLNVPSDTDDEESSLLQSCLDMSQKLLDQQKALCSKREDKLKTIGTNLKKNEDMVKSFQSKMQQLTQTHEKMNKEKTENEAFLKKRIEGLNGQLNNATNDLVAQEIAVKSLLEDKEARNKEMIDLKGENKSLKENLETLKRDLATAQEKVARREAILASLKVVHLDQVNLQGEENNETDKLRKEFKSLRKEIDSLKRQQTRNKQSSSTVRTRKTNHSQKHRGRRNTENETVAKTESSYSDASSDDSDCNYSKDSKSELVDPSLDKPLKNENGTPEMKDKFERDETAQTAESSDKPTQGEITETLKTSDKSAQGEITETPETSDKSAQGEITETPETSDKSAQGEITKIPETSDKSDETAVDNTPEPQNASSSNSRPNCQSNNSRVIWDNRPFPFRLTPPPPPDFTFTLYPREPNVGFRYVP